MKVCAHPPQAEASSAEILTHHIDSQDTRLTQGSDAGPPALVEAHQVGYFDGGDTLAIRAEVANSSELASDVGPSALAESQRTTAYFDGGHTLAMRAEAANTSALAGDVGHSALETAQQGTILLRNMSPEAPKGSLPQQRLATILGARRKVMRVAKAEPAADPWPTERLAIGGFGQAAVQDWSQGCMDEGVVLLGEGTNEGDMRPSAAGALPADPGPLPGLGTGSRRLPVPLQGSKAKAAAFSAIIAAAAGARLAGSADNRLAGAAGSAGASLARQRRSRSVSQAPKQHRGRHAAVAGCATGTAAAVASTACPGRLAAACACQAPVPRRPSAPPPRHGGPRRQQDMMARSWARAVHV